MSQERFIERQADVRASSMRLREALAQPESDLIRDEYSAPLNAMAGRIQSLAWD